MKHVFIVGSKGIPARYGGFETFVEKLTEYKQNKEIRYHVACTKNENGKEVSYVHNDAECFTITVPAIGPAKAVYYDIKAIQWVIRYIKENELSGSVIYILACRIGPFMNHFKKQLKKLNCVVMVNPDGHEWKRGKWNTFIKKYWKYSERLMVKYSDLLICDSVNIEKYIQQEYKQYQPKTCYIAYGAEQLQNTSADMDGKLSEWLEEKKLQRGSYYLMVGRFVPENNYETVIREFMKSYTSKKLVLISNVEHNKYFEQLRENTGFENDERIVFAGTVYDPELLQAVRQNAYGYIHGHEVGGTNPSLLEALASTDLNLLLDVPFNEEVGEDAAIYWKKESGSLQAIINQMDSLAEKEKSILGYKAKERIKTFYSWNKIVEEYEQVFKE